MLSVPRPGSFPATPRAVEGVFIKKELSTDEWLISPRRRSVHQPSPRAGRAYPHPPASNSPSLLFASLYQLDTRLTCAPFQQKREHTATRASTHRDRPHNNQLPPARHNLALHPPLLRQHMSLVPPIILPPPSSVAFDVRDHITGLDANSRVPTTSRRQPHAPAASYRGRTSLRPHSTSPLYAHELLGGAGLHKPVVSPRDTAATEVDDDEAAFLEETFALSRSRVVLVRAILRRTGA